MRYFFLVIKKFKKIENIAKKYEIKLNIFAKAVRGSYKSSFPTIILKIKKDTKLNKRIIIETTKISKSLTN